ncbi:MAG TPA: hypothetical protein VKP60_02305 [Magnetospirillaceae bacterium]|nr:hypothetical protein [Magnetospirillaceae bacterium]
MNHAIPSPMAMLRSMMQSVDSGIEDAIDAHGFSFSALSADEEGAVLHFDTPATEPAAIWHLTLNLPPDGRSRVALRRGSAEAPSVALTLSVGDGACRDLPAALGIAMELFTTIGQP